MRIAINLATRPFVELRPFFLRLRVLMGVLAITGLAAIVAAHILKTKLDIADAQIERLHAKTVAAQQEKSGNERRMRQPANAAVLDRAHFLNTLFLRKSFSWTAVMMDLETVLPSGVQVMNIDPVISSKDGKVTIRLRVSGAHDKAVDLVRNLEHSHRFLAPRLARETAENNQNGNRQVEQISATSNVNFDLLAEYNPLPEKDETPAAKHDHIASGKTVLKGRKTPLKGKEGMNGPPRAGAR